MKHFLHFALSIITFSISASAQVSANTEMERLKDLTEIAKKMPKSVEIYDLLGVIQKSLSELDVVVNKDTKALAELSAVGYLDMIGADKSGNWSVAEMKKADLGSFVPAVINLKDGRTVKKEMITMLNPSGLRWIGDRIEETNWNNLPDQLAKDYGWNKSRQLAYEEWKGAATLKANANASEA